MFKERFGFVKQWIEDNADSDEDNLVSDARGQALRGWERIKSCRGRDLRQTNLG
jgi:hypothetical protein